MNREQFERLEREEALEKKITDVWLIGVGFGGLFIPGVPSLLYGLAAENPLYAIYGTVSTVLAYTMILGTIGHCSSMQEQRKAEGITHANWIESLKSLDGAGI